MNKFALLLLTILVIACSPTVDPEYRAEIEKYRSSRSNGLVKGKTPSLNENQLADLKYYDINPKFKIEATLVRTKNTKAFYIPTFDGKTKDYRKYGYLDFSIGGKKHQLSLYQDITNIEKYPQSNFWYYLMVPFTDKTNGNGSYEGGRYMLMDRRKLEKPGPIFIDFNKAYNPICAYADGFTCPIPPEENDLPVKIKAGEKAFK